MKKIALLALFVGAVIVGPAAAAQDASGNTAPTKLSVSQAINAGVALKQLGGFKFAGDTLMKMAEMLEQAEKVQKNYTDAFNALVKQTYGSMEVYSNLQITMTAEAKKIDAGQMAPADRTTDPKREAFVAEADKMFAGPASFSVAKIKRSELCLAKAAPACPQANAIPVDVLRALLPVMEK